MGSGASSQMVFEQMLACTMILGDAMVQGLDPRYVRFPDLYRLYDFHVGPKQTQRSTNILQNNNMILLLQSPTKNNAQPILLTNSAMVQSYKNSINDELVTSVDDDDRLIVYLQGDKVILQKSTLNTPNKDGWTPLHACCHNIASQDAGLVILQELLNNKTETTTAVDLNIQTKRGPGSFSYNFTPLHIATAYGLERLAIELIRQGADVNTKNSVNWTPLYDACHRGYHTIARELLKAGACHNIRCPEFALCPFPGQLPLAEAARQGHLETVKLLLEWPVDKDAANNLGWTALHEAAYHGRLPVVQMLIVYGANVTLRTSKGSMAKDVTISAPIKTMLEDLSKQNSTLNSPKKHKVSENSRGEDKDECDKSSHSFGCSKSFSVAQAAAIAPLSRKEEYQLLGDLPSLDARVPSIQIQDHGDCETTAIKHDYMKEIDGDDNEPTESALTKSYKSKTNSKKKKTRRKDIPSQFKCSISRKLMTEPLKSPFGHVYEKSVIEAWFHDFGNRCPLTGEPLTLQQLTPHDELSDQIKLWLSSNHCLKQKPEEDGSRRQSGERPVLEERATKFDDQGKCNDNDLYDF